MSSHHLDLQILQDPEIPAAEILPVLYGRLHLVLARGRCEAIAVAFPGYDAARRTLGTSLRLIGGADDLLTLLAQPWLGGLRDHLQISGVTAVPAAAEPRTLRRVQAKSNPERLRRRQMRRHGLTDAQARERVPDSMRESLDLPCITLTSASTGQTFPLFLRLSSPQPGAVAGPFNSYGLSSVATIPWF